MNSWGKETEYERAKAKSERRNARLAKYRRKKDDVLGKSGVQKESSNQESVGSTREDIQKDGKVRSLPQAKERN
jgi:hypothetical protein